MKRMLSVWLICCLMFTLTACSRTGEITPPVEDKTETTAPADPMPEDETEDPAKDAPVAAPRDPGLQIERTTYRHILRDEVTDALLCEVTWDSLQLTEESAERYPKLASELRKEGNRTYEQHGLVMEDLSMQAYDAVAEQMEGFNGYTSSTKAYVHHVDEKILSVRMYHDEYTGGAHPNYGVTALNYDIETGEVLELQDVVTDVPRLAYTLADKIQHKYDYEQFDGLLEQLKKYKGDDYTWTLGPQGITFWFSPYEIAPYAAGLLTTTITYTEWPTIFVPEYVVDQPNWMIELPFHQEIEVDFDASDAQVDRVRMAAYTDAKGIMELYLVVNDENEYAPYDYHAYEARTWLACVDGAQFLFMEGIAESDMATLYVYRLTDEGLVLTDTIDGGMTKRWESGINKDSAWTEALWLDSTCVELTSVVQLLGTWVGSRAYTFDGAEGTFHADGNVYGIRAEDSIHTAVEIEAVVDGKTEKLPAGTELWMVRTDGETYAELQNKDGRICRIEITYTDHQPLIGGIPEWECFSDLRYAG